MNKADGTTKGICAALRGVGAKVSQIQSASGERGVPDLLVSFKGSWFVMEVKNPEGRNRIDPAQAKFQLDSRATVHVVRTPEDALQALGVIS